MSSFSFRPSSRRLNLCTSFRFVPRSGAFRSCLTGGTEGCGTCWDRWKRRWGGKARSSLVQRGDLTPRFERRVLILVSSLCLLSKKGCKRFPKLTQADVLPLSFGLPTPARNSHLLSSSTRRLEDLSEPLTPSGCTNQDGLQRRQSRLPRWVDDGTRGVGVREEDGGLTRFFRSSPRFVCLPLFSLSPLLLLFFVSSLLLAFPY